MTLKAHTGFYTDYSPLFHSDHKMYRVLMITTNLSAKALTKLTEFYTNHSPLFHSDHKMYRVLMLTINLSANSDYKTYRVLCLPLTSLPWRSQNVQSSVLTTHLSAMAFTKRTEFWAYH
jgi:hypothetical protein